MHFPFAIHKWPKMVSIHLWPYAMHTANEIMISTPTMGKMETPQELFGQVNIAPKSSISIHSGVLPRYNVFPQGNEGVRQRQILRSNAKRDTRP